MIKLLEQPLQLLRMLRQLRACKRHSANRRLQLVRIIADRLWRKQRKTKAHGAKTQQAEPQCFFVAKGHKLLRQKKKKESERRKTSTGSLANLWTWIHNPKDPLNTGVVAVHLRPRWKKHQCLQHIFSRETGVEALKQPLENRVPDQRASKILDLASNLTKGARVIRKHVHKKSKSLTSSKSSIAWLDVNANIAGKVGRRSSPRETWLAEFERRHSFQSSNQRAGRKTRHATWLTKKTLS
jgi:hypothetical protein